MSSLQASEDRAAEGAVAPRVTLENMEAKVASCVFFTGGAAHRQFTDEPGTPPSPSLEVLTICLLTTTSGFTLIGKSAPADPRNYDHRKGREFSYEDAIRQMWQLEGYLLREQLAG